MTRTFECLKCGFRHRDFMPPYPEKCGQCDGELKTIITDTERVNWLIKNWKRSHGVYSMFVNDKLIIGNSPREMIDAVIEEENNEL